MPKRFAILAAALLLAPTAAAGQDSPAPGELDDGDYSDPSFGGFTRFTNRTDPLLDCPPPEQSHVTCRFTAPAVEGLKVVRSEIRFSYDTILDARFDVAEDFEVAKAILAARFGPPEDEELVLGRSASWYFGLDPMENGERFYIQAGEEGQPTATAVQVFFSDDYHEDEGGCAELPPNGERSKRC